MKKILLFFIFLPFYIFAAEAITNYDINIDVDKGGVLHITENITYATDSSDKRGIFRVIPYKYSNGSYTKFEDRVKIDKFSARYSSPLDREVEVSKTNRSNVEVFRLGSNDEFLRPNTEYTYTLKYDVYNVIRSQNGINQIFFNAIGNYWEFPILNANITITGIKGDLEAFVGKVGDTGKEYEVTEIENGYKIKVTRQLDQKEGLSFILNSNSFKYSQTDLWKNRFKAYPDVFLTPIIIVLIILINILIMVFRVKNRIKKAIAVEYNPPKVSPNIAKRIVGSNKYKDLMIVIFTLIQKDIIKYKEKNDKHNEDEEYVIKYGEARPSEKKKGFDDYVEKVYYIDAKQVEKLKDELTDEEDEALLSLIHNKNDVFGNKKYLAKAESNASSRLSGIFSRYYAVPVFNYVFITFILMIITIILGIIFEVTYGYVVISVVAFVLTYLNALTVVRYTKEYEKAYLDVKGFEKFLLNVEAKEFAYFTEQEDIIRYFKGILPYALALGLENRYLKLLDGVIDKYDLDRPSIYEYTLYYHLINRSFYASSINRALYNNSNNTNFNSFGGNSSFGGGFSSSGSAGGGFGGGGGGSW